MSRLWKNWTVHNLVSHPLSEIVYLITRRDDWAGVVHDFTIPDHDPGTGRG